MSPSFIWPVRIYFEDTDAGGIVFYGNYLKFYERARTEWLRSLGISQQWLMEEYKIIFVVRNVSIDYLRSALLDDELLVTTEILQIRGASIEFSQTIWRNDMKLSAAAVKIVCVNKDKMRPKPIPEPVLEKMRMGIRQK